MPSAVVGVAADDLERQVGAPRCFSSRVQLMTSGFGQTTRPVRIMPGVEQQPQREDHLRRLAEAHLVGEQRGMPRHQEGDAFELVRERLERQLELSAAKRSSSGGCSR